MTLPVPLIIVLAYVVPIVLLIVVGRMRIRRHRAALALEGESKAKPFEPADEPQPGFFLRRFTLPQRAYLRTQSSLARGCYLICAWMLFVVLSVNLLPQHVHAYSPCLSWPQQVWGSYLDGFGMTSILMVCMFAVFTASISTTDLQAPPGAIFVRTRPLSLRFLFWGRVGLALAILLAAVLTALLGSWLLLLIFYGPVWSQLQIATVTPEITHRVVTLGTSHRTTVSLAPSGHASLLRLWFLLLTMSAFLFSFTVTMVLQDFFSFRKTKSKFWPALIGGLVGSQLFHFGRFVLSLPFTKVLFYSPGPLPLYLGMLLSILLVVALLWVAQRFSARFEP